MKNNEVMNFNPDHPNIIARSKHGHDCDNERLLSQVWDCNFRQNVTDNYFFEVISEHACRKKPQTEIKYKLLRCQPEIAFFSLHLSRFFSNFAEFLEQRVQILVTL